VTEQLNLLGERTQPADLHLGPLQREVMEFVRAHETISKDEAGQIAHARRGKHGADELCAFCSIDGAPILKSLRDRGLLEKRRDGLARLPGVQAPQRGPGNEIPF
jgi:hypothetical protein